MKVPTSGNHHGWPWESNALKGLLGGPSNPARWQKCRRSWWRRGENGGPGTTRWDNVCWGLFFVENQSVWILVHVLREKGTPSLPQGCFSPSQTLNEPSSALALVHPFSHQVAPTPKLVPVPPAGSLVDKDFSLSLWCMPSSAGLLISCCRLF